MMMKRFFSEEGVFIHKTLIVRQRPCHGYQEFKGTRAVPEGMFRMHNPPIGRSAVDSLHHLVQG